MRLWIVVCVLTLAWAGAVAGTQQPPSAQEGGTLPGGFDSAAVTRGKELHVAQCGFCHGINARGGSGGPDLTRSALVQEDEDGKQLGAFLRVGRPDRGMPPFQFSEQESSDLAAFLHSEIFLAANRRYYQVLDILTGDPKAGEAFFNGPGKCTSCHSASGDLNGIGAKYDPTTLQVRMLNPRQGRGSGSDGPPPRPYLAPNALTVTVTLPSGVKASGTLVRLTDFDVTLYDGGTGEVRSWIRTGDVPNVVVTDPLQAHLDMWKRWTDTDMHNVTAYLASLK
jgi:cytochrome c oxidase cbb3-type subunit III